MYIATENYMLVFHAVINLALHISLAILLCTYVATIISDSVYKHLKIFVYTMVALICSVVISSPPVQT